MAPREWVYVKVYVHDRPEMLDWLIVAVLPRVCEQLAGSRWFFLRYFDASGVHLRVRFEAAGENAERVRALLIEALTVDYTVLDRAGFSGFTWFAPRLAGPPTPGAAATRVVSDVYEPEVATYGHTHMRAAEDLFTCSSEEATAVLVRRRTAAGDDAKRAALGFMQTVREAFVAERDEAAFWSAYRDHWLGSDANLAAVLRAGIERNAQRAASGLRAAPIPRSARWSAAVAAAARAYAGAASVAAVRQFIHLTNNRLGITLMEEAYLAQLQLALGCVAR